MRAVYTFIGNSVWKDDKGQLWCAKQHENPDVKTSIELDVEGRDDLEFMVNYGEMKKFVIEEKADSGKKEDDTKEDCKKEDGKKDIKINVTK